MLGIMKMTVGVEGGVGEGGVEEVVAKAVRGIGANLVCSLHRDGGCFIEYVVEYVADLRFFFFDRCKYGDQCDFSHEVVDHPGMPL